MNKHKEITITRQTIAQLLNTTEENIRIKEFRGEFDFNNIESVILYLAAQIISKQIRTKP